MRANHHQLASQVPEVPRVLGKTIDQHTRCVHWHGPKDIIAIKFWCCGNYYPCYECHAETSKHPPQVIPASQYHQPAVLCGACNNEFSVDLYLASHYTCPHCQADFNPGCALHANLYFEPAN